MRCESRTMGLNYGSLRNIFKRTSLLFNGRKEERYKGKKGQAKKSFYLLYACSTLLSTISQGDIIVFQYLIYMLHIAA